MRPVMIWRCATGFIPYWNVRRFPKFGWRLLIIQKIDPFLLHIEWVILSIPNSDSIVIWSSPGLDEEHNE